MPVHRRGARVRQFAPAFTTRRGDPLCTCTETRRLTLARLENIARSLEWAVLAVATAGVAFRLAWYGHMPKADGARYGSGDVVEFGLTFVLFALSTACAACGVAMSLRSEGAPNAKAYRPLLIGITTFVAYYFLAPRLPPLF